MSKKHRLGVCTYCGAKGYITDDHVPPKNLFEKPRPSNLITVPACDECNGRRFSRDDEYFRMVFALRENSKNNPDREGVLPAIKRSLNREEARGMREALFSRL